MGEKLFENVFENEFYKENYESAKNDLKDADPELIESYIAMNRALLFYSIQVLVELSAKSAVLEQKLDAFMLAQKKMTESFESILKAKSNFDQQVREVVDLILKEKGLDRGRLH